MSGDAKKNDDAKKWLAVASSPSHKACLLTNFMQYFEAVRINGDSLTGFGKLPTGITEAMAALGLVWVMQPPHGQRIPTFWQQMLELAKSRKNTTSTVEREWPTPSLMEKNQNTITHAPIHPHAVTTKTTNA
ncbi:hypothetical protein F5Y00DRAFT_257494 [Daldinia vernicosa]|uniref:uncharacterized protein n=1 Tax=Daldinia vernicosa TaxID=114800 RepID=UPI0020077D11|nr:uncharacterized protein F5Y00DRAFT_257494 [Daldinia vernicosa]KAI0853474.1 hypothetical protein F5Y00DRAFT_257494 [Daldinia vernicosa]